MVVFDNAMSGEEADRLVELVVSKATSLVAVLAKQDGTVANNHPTPVGHLPHGVSNTAMLINGERSW
jgi:hypothetical protein